MSRINRQLIALNILTLTIALAFAGCNRKTVFSHYAHTDIEHWANTDTVCFDIPVCNGGRFAETIGLRAVISYPYQSITLCIEQSAQQGISLTDTATIEIYNQKGRPTGKSLDRRQYEIPLRHIDILDNDTLHVKIHHIMSDAELQGVTDVGFRLEQL